VLVLFLGAMNGLVLANDLMHLYFFFEVTTLCSFLLIGHDGTEEARANSLRALWMNSLGGVFFALALVWGYVAYDTTSIQQILQLSPATQLMLMPVALLALAGFTKAAQLPFQSWLLGAMVAPTPTSALLHSSTMVKAGVYIVLRMSPAMADTSVSLGVALVGAFTFLAAAVLALGQSNGKKILAYSTVSNLGLILACAGINTPLAITAAILLIIFHAVSKGLLFLCVGTIEQAIASRDIEDMRGLLSKMPLTATVSVLAMLTMILPPFGMLVGKWLAIQSAQTNFLIIILLALGSAVNVVYWVRWAGSLMATKPAEPAPMEKLKPLMRFPMLTLLGLAAGMSLAAPVLYAGLQTRIVGLYNTLVYTAKPWTDIDLTVLYVIYPLFALALVGVFLAWLAAQRVSKSAAAPPYMSGVHVRDGYFYRGPMNNEIEVSASHYYLSTIFKENPMTIGLNLAAIVLLLFMAGGGL
jgi:ech hydrogenase subunit A